jgi:hypothetical protein
MFDDFESATRIIIDASRAGRRIVPFLGAGVSLAAGFPTISLLTDYLARVQFAVDRAIYRSRYPMVSDGIETAVQRYKRRPAEFIEDFGWPEIGQLNADLWRWLVRRKSGRGLRTDKKKAFRTPDDIVQSIFRARLRQSEPHVADAIKKKSDADQCKLLGDWTAMLDHLSEGQVDLIDSLFTGLEQGRSPTRAQIFLTFLTELMGIRLGCPRISTRCWNKH